MNTLHLANCEELHPDNVCWAGFLSECTLHETWGGYALYSAVNSWFIVSPDYTLEKYWYPGAMGAWHNITGQYPRYHTEGA